MHSTLTLLLFTTSPGKTADAKRLGADEVGAPPQSLLVGAGAEHGIACDIELIQDSADQRNI